MRQAVSIPSAIAWSEASRKVDKYPCRSETI
jgi:hypothetical protein